jgi:hypothetical protein
LTKIASVCAPHASSSKQILDPVKTWLDELN